MFSRGPVAMHPPMNPAQGMVAPPGARGGPGGGAPISVQRPSIPQNHAYPPGPPYAVSSSPMLQTYAAGAPTQAPGPTPSTSRLQHSMAPQQGPSGGGFPQYSVEQAISQSLPPGASARPYPASSTSFPSQPPRPPPPTHSLSHSHPPPRPPQPTRRYSSAGRYTEPGDQTMGSGIGPERAGAGDAYREIRMPPSKPAVAWGEGAEMEGAPVGYEQDARFEGKPVFGGAEPDHRHLFHSYILDYLQKQGYHAAAQAFLHDVPDTPVQQRPGKGKDRATPRDEDQHSEHDDASPRGAPSAFTNGIGGMSKSHETNSPHEPHNRPQSSGHGATDSSIGSTNSSSSHFGFPSNKTGTASPSTSPDLDHRSLPQALVQIESPQGFLFEWWTVFWDVFRAKAEKGGTASARAYVDASTAAVDLALRSEMARLNGESFPSRQYVRPVSSQNVPLPPSPPPQPARHYLAPDRPYPAPPLQGQPSLQNPLVGPNIAQRPQQMAPPQMSQQQQQQAAAQAQAARGYSERVHVGPGGAGAGGGPGGLVGGHGPHGIPRQATLHRRGALSPMPPPPGYVISQAPQQSSSQMQFRPPPNRLDRERQQYAQQQQDQARQAQFAQPLYQGPPQPQQHLPPQQLASSQQQQRFDPAYQEHIAQAQVASIRVQNAAAQAQAQAQAQRGAKPGSATGSPHAANGIPLRDQRRSSNAEVPYAQQHVPATAHAMASLDFHASPSKRFKSIPGAGGDNSERLPSNGTSTGYSQQGSDAAVNAYRAQLSSNQNGALSYALSETSLHPHAPSPYPSLQYATDPQARPPPPARTASAQYQGGPPGQQDTSSPHSNAGPYGTPDYGAGSPAFNSAVLQGYPPQNGAHSRPPSVGPSQQSMLDQQYRQLQQLEDSMPPPPVGPPPIRRTLSQIGGGASNAPTPQAQTPASHHGSPSLPTPQTPGGAIAVASGASGKRKRETKDAREPKKRATAKGRDRSDSMASTVPAPTPSPAAGTPQYTQSPAPITTTSPVPSAALSSDLAGLGGLYPYSVASDLGIGMAPSLIVDDDLGIPPASIDHMDNIFTSADFGTLSTDETFDYNSWVHTNSFDAFPDA